MDNPIHRVTCVCMYICIYAFIYVCISACMYICIYVCVSDVFREIEWLTDISHALPLPLLSDPSLSASPTVGGILPGLPQSIHPVPPAPHRVPLSSPANHHLVRDASQPTRPAGSITTQGMSQAPIVWFDNSKNKEEKTNLLRSCVSSSTHSTFMMLYQHPSTHSIKEGRERDFFTNQEALTYSLSLRGRCIGFQCPSSKACHALRTDGFTSRRQHKVFWLSFIRTECCMFLFKTITITTIVDAAV